MAQWADRDRLALVLLLLAALVPLLDRPLRRLVADPVLPVAVLAAALLAAAAAAGAAADDVTDGSAPRLRCSASSSR